jgi:hypothetical protein
VFMRNSLIVFLLLLLSFSCRDKIACPTFQSTYILDDSTRMAYYSYAWKLDKDTREKFLASAYGDGDSLAAGSSSTLRYYDYVEDIIQPREQVRRSKYGIVKYEPMWLKNYKLKTAPKENVLGPEPVEKDKPAPIDVGEFVASDFTDSLSSDSTMMVLSDSSMTSGDTVMLARAEDTRPKKKEVKYLYRYDPDSLNNVEQEYYNKYYGELLIDYASQRREQQEKLRIAEEAAQQANATPADTTQTGEDTKRKFSLRKGKDEAYPDQSSDQPKEDPTQEENKSENENEEGGGN